MNCKALLGVVGRVWALLAVFGLLAFGFIGFMPWVPLPDSGLGVLRGLVIVAACGIGLGCAFTYVNDCR